MKNEFMTNLDKLGMKIAARERLEKNLGIWRKRIRHGKITSLESFDDLLKRDGEREKDGFPKRIKSRRILIAPGKVIVIPYVEEEHLMHGEFEPKNIVTKLDQSPTTKSNLATNLATVKSNLTAAKLDDEYEPDIAEAPGHGDGEVGDVIGEVPIGGSGDGGDGDGDGDEPGPGAGDEPGEHGFEEEAYEAGKRLTEQLQLPNLKEKTKKVPSDEYTYDLIDRHDGSGQVLDEEETIERIVETNLILGRITKDNPDPKKMIVSPEDEVYRVLSRERVWKSQAVVFFMRDYSGSMWGDPTEALISQHLMIYSWLLYQYEKRVIPRFIVHDTRGGEVTARQYFYSGSGGGTLIASGYQKINEIVEGESLENDYNIYVFQGTDGDDFDWRGEQALPEINKILRYVNRMGVTLFKHPYYGDRKTAFEEYVERGGILEQKDLFRMHIMSGYDVSEEQNIEALKVLIAQD